MSTKETIFIFFIIFVSGFVASQLIKADISATAVIPFLVMVGAFLGVIFNRIKHIDDLNLSRKKDVSLEFVGIMSEYGTVLISIIDQNVKPETFHSNLNKATQNMNMLDYLSMDRIYGFLLLEKTWCPHVNRGMTCLFYIICTF